MMQGPAVPKMAIATAVLETETERDRDATAIVERAKKLQQAEGAPPSRRVRVRCATASAYHSLWSSAAMAGSDKKVYRGQANYTQYIDPGDTSGQIKGAGIRAGPVRASLYARAITRWDYQPDICKDYKETGTLW
jgi:RING finger protein 113A